MVVIAMNRKFTFLMIFLCMHIGAMDTTKKDLGNLICNHADFRSEFFKRADIDLKNNLCLTSKTFLNHYNTFIKNLTFNEYIDGLYLLYSHERQFSAWVHQENVYKQVQWFCGLKEDQQLALVSKLKMYRNSLINYDIWQYKSNERFWLLNKKIYMEKKQEWMQSDENIVNCIAKVIRINNREQLKFCVPCNDTGIAISLFQQRYSEIYYDHILKDICSFFDQESLFKYFTTIENNILENKIDIIKKINEALEKKNFSVLVFLLYWRSRMLPEYDIKSFFNAVTDGNKRVLVQAGYEVRLLIMLLREAADNNKVERVKFFINLILESGNLYSFDLETSEIYRYVFEFKLYDLIPKLFKEKYFSSLCFSRTSDADKIHTIIKTCYDHYEKNLWKDEKSKDLLYFALCSVAYDQKLFDYLSSIVDTLPFPDYHRRLLEDVQYDKDNESFGKKMEFLFSKGIEIMFFQVFLVNSLFKHKDYYNSDLYRIMCNVSEEIIIKSIQEKKQCVNQAIGVSFIQDLLYCAVIAQKWRIVNYLLPDVIFEHIQYMTYYDDQDNCIFFLNQLVEHCPDQMLVCLKKYMQGDDGPFFMTDHNCFIAKILSSAIDAQRLDIVKFLLLHNEVCLLSGYPEGFRISNFLMDNAFTEVIQNCKKWNNITSLLSCAESCYLNKIVVNLQQDQLINIEQVFQWNEQGKFSNQRCKELINIVLNEQGLDDDKIKKLLLDVIHKREFLFLKWLLKRTEINIVRHLPKDKMDEVLTYCRKGVIRHIKQTSFTYDERKEFLYRVGIRKVVDLIFHGWWDSLSDLKKIFISGSFMVPLASFIVGLCYRFKYVNSVV